ncbi:hypothetical protein [Kineococcus sp. SYSU DK002]|uniref:hypothetical protein n=1 Tax=Kineococcus sp. SYSU DK002 TaxID=3383123 RepID=UPI003D7D80EB
MSLSVCRTPSVADWITGSTRPWHQLVALGPAGLPAYARLRFLPDPTHPGQGEGDVEFDEGPDAPSENDRMRSAATILAAHTSTPDECFFAVWDGWGLVPTDPATTRIEVPNRGYSLFRGAVPDFGDGREWSRVFNPPPYPWRAGPDPAFTWPRDRAWCLTKDVDPHYATIGASRAAVRELLDHPDLDVVPLEPGEEPPHYL